MFELTYLIGNDWVLVFIIAELIVTLGSDLSCLLLSLNLMERLKRSAAAKRSCGEVDGDRDGDGDGVAGSVSMTGGGNGGDIDRLLLSLLEEDHFKRYTIRRMMGEPVPLHHRCQLYQ